MYKSKLVRHIPNILTMVNMLLGFSAILLLLRTDWRHTAPAVAAFIICGGVLDFFDGRLARRWGAVTALGKQLDSFADMVTFGVAPVCLAHFLAVCQYSVLITISSGLFLIAGAYRLARYNLGDFSTHFSGLPITAAGVALGVYCMTHPLWPPHPPIVCTVITAALILLLSVMMVSKVKVKRR